jgi:ABC-type multidrug transport system permease subunit
MGRIAKLRALVRKDLLRQVRSPTGTLLILSFPLLFSGLLALSFGGGGDRVPKVRLLIEDQGSGLVGDLVRSAFTNEQAAKYFDVEVVKDDGRERIEKNKASALLILPEGMTNDLLNREPVTLRLLRNPSEEILPEIAEQLTIILAEVLDGAVRVLGGPLDQIQPFLKEGADTPPDAGVASTAVAINQVISRAERYVFPPVIKLETAARKTDEDEGEDEDGDTSRSASIFLLILPGVAVFSLFTLCDQLMRDVLREEKLGTLRRQLSGPLSVGELILGKCVVSALITILGAVVLSAATLLVARQGVSFLGFSLLICGLVMAATGAATLIYGLARSERQGATIASTVYLVLGFSSGSFVPLSSMPAAIRAIAPFTPFYWATEGFKSLIFEDAGAVQLGPNIAVLVGLGAFCLVLGSFLLRRKILRGATA